MSKDQGSEDAKNAKIEAIELLLAALTDALKGVQAELAAIKIQANSAKPLQPSAGMNFEDAQERILSQIGQMLRLALGPDSLEKSNIWNPKRT